MQLNHISAVAMEPVCLDYEAKAEQTFLHNHDLKPPED